MPVPREPRRRPRRTTHTITGAFALVCLLPTAALASATPGRLAPPGAGQNRPRSVTGVAWSWGANSSGELGYGTQIDSHRPFPVTGLDSVTALAGGVAAAYALRRDGTVWAWGANGAGRLGDTTTTSRSTPGQVVGLDEVTAVAAGALSGYALRRDGTVWAWGSGERGELGNGTTTDSSTPVQVAGLTDVTAVAAANSTAVALRRDGTVWAWGQGDDGELGTGTTTDSSTPVQVHGLTDASAVAVGGHAVYALRRDGTVRAWGWNNSGKLGDGTTTDSTVPVQVAGLDQVTAIAAGWASAYALRRDGTVRAWGYNNHGQLGNASTTTSSTPVEVDGLGDVSAISAGSYAGYAVRRDGSAWAWGSNDHGELGDDTTTDSHTPVRVAVPAPVTAIVGGGSLAGSAYALGGPARHPRELAPTARLSLIPELGSAPSVALADAAASAPGSAPLASYTFDFGDGTLTGPSTDVTATHLYPDPGTYQVTLTVTDSTGATTRQTRTVGLRGPGRTGPAITWTPGGATPRGCNHCAGVHITSSGTEPLTITSVTPAPRSEAYPTSTCPAVLPVGGACDIWWTDTGGPPGTNHDVIIRHNAPGGLTIV